MKRITAIHCSNLSIIPSHVSVMVASSHRAQLGRFWVTEKQILLAAGSTGYNSVVLWWGPAWLFLPEKLLCILNPQTPGRNEPSRWRDGRAGASPCFPTPNLLPLLNGVGFPGGDFGASWECWLLWWEICISNQTPFLLWPGWAAHPQHSWQVLLLGTAQKCCGAHPTMVWASPSALLSWDVV